MRLSNGEVLLRWPLAQHIITAGWLYNDGSLHRALDFRAAVGTPVYAAEAGTVETAYRWNGRRTQGDTNSYGNMLKLRHADYRGGRLETLYAHLSKLCVAQGETVYEGQLIGYSGDTGNCYGAHLHFEVRYKNRRVHPLNWLDADFAAASTAVRLGATRALPVRQRKTQPVQMQTVTVGPISNGDAARLYALCGDLGLVESGCTTPPIRRCEQDGSNSGGADHRRAEPAGGGYHQHDGCPPRGTADGNGPGGHGCRLEELTREVRAHNNFAQRVPVLEEQLRVANHRLSNLEKAHTPASRAIS